MDTSTDSTGTAFCAAVTIEVIRLRQHFDTVHVDDPVVRERVDSELRRLIRIYSDYL